MPVSSYSLELEEDPGTFVTVTNEDLETALGGRGGTVSRHWIFEWRDTAYTLLDDPIAGAIQPGGSLKMSSDAEIPLTGDLTVVPQRLPFSLVSGNNHLAIVLALAIDGVFVKLPQAIMRVDTGDEEVRETGTSTAKLTLVDLSDYLLGKTTDPYIIAAGSNVGDEIERILDGLGLQHDIPASVSDITPAIISVGPGTQWRVIVDRLTDVSNLYPIAPDARGIFSTERRIIPKAVSDQEYNIIEPTLLYPPLRRKPDRTGRFANRAVNLFDHPDRNASYVEVVNNDPASNISIPSMNETITEKLKNGGYVLNPDRAEEYATWFLRHQHALANKAELITVLDPRQTIHRQYQLNLPGIEEGTRWELLGWNIDLSANGKMTHLIGRAEDIEVTTLVKPTS